MATLTVTAIGSVITRTRDDSTISAIVGDRCGSSTRGRGWSPPMVIIDEQTNSLGGPDDARLWQQDANYAFRCYGNTNQQAEQIAHAVIGLWHEACAEGPLEVSTVRFRGSWLIAYNGPVEEPKLKKPVAVVRMRILAAGAAIA